MPTLSIRCGKATEAWLRNALSTETEVPISQIIDLAIQYYDATGEFVQLGTVSLKEENPQLREKRLYFKKNSPVWDIIKWERENNYRLPKDIISEVLYGGLEIADKTEFLSVDEYTKALFDLNKRKGKSDSRIERPAPVPAARKPQQSSQRPGRTEVSDEDIMSVVEDVQKEQKKPKAKKGRIGFADQFITSF